MKCNFLLAFVVILAALLVGCSETKETPRKDTANDKMRKDSGHIVYYAEPVFEFKPGTVSREDDLTAEQAQTLRDILDGVSGWTNDHICDRDGFYFDGKFTLKDNEYVYYFSYEQKVIYYDHFFGTLTKENVATLKTLLDSRS